jgi:DNA repair protein RadC
VKAAAATLGVRFLDHLIIGDAAPFSFKAGGLL